MDGTPNSATFNIEIVKPGHAIVMREIIFQNGNNISFSVVVDTDSLEMKDIHKKSVGLVIEQLQAWIAPK